LTARCAAAANALLQVHAARETVQTAAVTDAGPASAQHAMAVHSAGGQQTLIPRWSRASLLWPRHHATNRPFCSFHAVAAISYEAIRAAANRGYRDDDDDGASTFVSVTERGGGASRFDALAEAYMAAAAARAGVSRDDIAFLQSSPFAVNASGDTLGFSTCCGSAECAVSMFLLMVVFIMDVFMLLGQQTALRAALGGGAHSGVNVLCLPCAPTKESALRV
jgi:hypothetical protein